MKVHLITGETLDNYPALQSSGLSPRRGTGGAEHELVLEYVQSCLPTPSQGLILTVFLEPRVAARFPDIVAVYWSERMVKSWSPARVTLTPFDVRLLHHLATGGPQDIPSIRTIFSTRATKSIRRLHAAELIDQTPQGWQAKPLQEIFAVQRLVAIEAKIKEWQSGLQQAVLNTWFASESYLLLPRLPKSLELVATARRLGVGLVTHQQPLDCPETTARQEQLPKSYASWLFNEWIRQAAHTLVSEVDEQV